MLPHGTVFQYQKILCILLLMSIFATWSPRDCVHIEIRAGECGDKKVARKEMDRESLRPQLLL